LGVGAGSPIEAVTMTLGRYWVPTMPVVIHSKIATAISKTKRDFRGVPIGPAVVCTAAAACPLSWSAFVFSPPEWSSEAVSELDGPVKRGSALSRSVLDCSGGYVGERR